MLNVAIGVIRHGKQRRFGVEMDCGNGTRLLRPVPAQGVAIAKQAYDNHIDSAIGRRQQMNGSGSKRQELVLVPIEAPKRALRTEVTGVIGSGIYVVQLVATVPVKVRRSAREMPGSRQPNAMCRGSRKHVLCTLGFDPWKREEDNEYWNRCNRAKRRGIEDGERGRRECWKNSRTTQYR